VFWCLKNKANNSNFHDGKYWTYNSIRSWRELFPYMGDKAIRNALKKLEDKGLIKSGNYNKVSYDRTKWYAVDISQLGNFHLPKGINEVVPKGEPIPYNKPDNKPYTKKESVSHLYSESFKILWSDYSEFGKRKKFMVGSKSKAHSAYQKLVKKMSDDDIYELVTLEADKEYAWRHLVTILNEKLRDVG